MSSVKKTKVTKKRRQVNPLKKWTPMETELILNYIQRNKNFEKPTAQCYYRQFLREAKVDAKWELLRWKVRNLKISLKKANEWQNSSDAAHLLAEEGFDAVRAKILKICPHYDRLRETFFMPREKNVKHCVSFSNSNTNSDAKSDGIINPEDCPPLYPHLSNQITSAPFVKTELLYDDLTEFIAQASNDAEAQVSLEPETQSTSVIEEKHNDESESTISADHRMETTTKSAISQLAAIQSERATLFERKLQFQREKFEREMEMEKRKLKIEEDRLKLEEYKLSYEQELRRKEFEYKRLEMEKDERIAKFEIEMKYKYNSK